MNSQIEKVISLAKSYVGTGEEPKGSNRNRFAKMIDEKFPDFYNGKKNGSAWCDEFVDAIFLELFGEEEALRLLCQPKKSCGAGCKFSAQYYKNAGRWFDKPEEGDQIFFYVGGDINHTGIVTKIDDKKVYTTEGNSGDMVKEHSYNKEGNKKIAGYGRPMWKEEAQTIADTAPTKPTQKPQNTTLKSEDEIAREIIAGKWGNGNERKKRLTEAGYNYESIQKKVNALLAKKPTQKPQNDAQKSLDEIAREIIAGKWGNGIERQRRLTEAGYDYAAAQKKVNEILNAKKPQGSSQKPAPASDTFIGIVNTVKDRLNVRTGAGMNYPVIKTLNKGSKVELYKKMVNGWYKLADGSGYVAGNLIKK